MVADWLPSLVQSHGLVDPCLLYTDEVIAEGAFDTLCDVNAAYLRGELSMTPYRDRPVGDETAAMLPKLLELNERGFMSTRSGSSGSSGSSGPTTQRPRRSFVCGYMSTRHYLPFYAFICGVAGVRFLLYRQGRLTHSNFRRCRRCCVDAGGRCAMDVGPLAHVNPAMAHAGTACFASSEFGNAFDVLRNRSLFVVVVGEAYGEGAVEDVLLDYFRGNRD